MNGCFSALHTRTPTTNEIDTCKWLVLTGDDWNPHSTPFVAYEEAAIHAMDKSIFPDRKLFAIHHQNGSQDLLADVSVACNNDNVMSHPALRFSAITTSPHLPRITKEKY
jgi:hypothetical protein